MSVCKPRVALIGCVESTQSALLALLEMDGALIDFVGLVTRKASTYNTDFVDLSSLVNNYGIATAYIEELGSESALADWLRGIRPDIVFVIGWSKLLGEDILNIPSKWVVGYHPAALPANRGRHPIVWALTLGLTSTASTFFIMSEAADDGPIISQVAVEIGLQDNARTLYDKLIRLIPIQVKDILSGVIFDTLTITPQDHSKANVWRKRTEIDGCIDWRMSTDSICNLVRALSHPYPGAFFMNNSSLFRVWHCVRESFYQINIEPGKVVAVDGGEVVVKTGDGAVRLMDFEMKNLPEIGCYL